MKRLLLVLVALLFAAAPGARAHVGNKDVFEQLHAGPYQIFVTVRPPVVIPGVATVEVRTSGPAVRSMTVTPVPLTGEASKHPPSADPMSASAADPAFFTGSLWLMSSGSWQVRIQIDGAGGEQAASVPVPAMPLSVLRMQRPLGITLALLGLFLILSMAGIVAAAVREGRLAPGIAPSPHRRRRALFTAAASLAVMAVAVYLGDRWWNVEAAGYSLAVYRPLALTPNLHGDTLNLAISAFNHPDNPRRSRSNADLLPDHGHLMHLYAVRMPGMDAAFHLHPTPVGPGQLQLQLPVMPPGTYKLFGDIVHANGFPETLTASLNLPPGLPGKPLDGEDASAAPPALSAGLLGTAYKLPDGYTMIWDRPSSLVANLGYDLRFRLVDPAGQPATGMEPYLGMAGHAAFLKADGTAFAHTHPEGSASMQAMDLANPGGMDDMPGMSSISPASPAPHEVLSPTVDFPYGFPSPGRYRIFVQMKHGHTVETGVFDAEVQSP